MADERRVPLVTGGTRGIGLGIAAKLAKAGFTVAIAGRRPPEEVQTNLAQPCEVRPGIIETDMTAGVKGNYDALIESGILLQKRWGAPEDIGTAVSMLARGELPYATGAVQVLDGGLTMARL